MTFLSMIYLTLQNWHILYYLQMALIYLSLEQIKRCLQNANKVLSDIHNYMFKKLASYQHGQVCAHAF